MLLITEFMSVADKAEVLCLPTNKLGTEGAGTIMTEFVINGVISCLSCESKSTVKATGQSIIPHSTSMVSDFICVENGSVNSNSCEVGTLAEKVIKDAVGISLTVVNYSSPKTSDDMLDINLSKLEVARIP